MGSLIDTKGNKIAGFDSIDKKQARENDFSLIDLVTEAEWRFLHSLRIYKTS